jgi:voltage-gated potassium channel
MTKGLDGASEAAARVDWRAGRQLRRRLFFTVIRIVLVTVVLCALYVLAPLDRSDGAAVVQLCLALLAYAGIVVWQIIAVVRSSYPRLRGIEAVAVSFPLLIFLFASIYVVMEHANPGSFSEPISRVDAIYFTVTVFATVGFGDIAARSEPARVLVTVQMLADLLLIGVIAKVLLGAVQRRTQVLTTSRDAGDAARADGT